MTQMEEQEKEKNIGLHAQRPNKLEEPQQNYRTPKYDNITIEAKKWIAAGGTKFVKKLCYALKEDWYPDVTKEEIRTTPQMRNRIKHKIMADWCTDNRVNREKSPYGWTGFAIWLAWPDFVRLPPDEETETDPNLLAAREDTQEFANSLPDKQMDNTVKNIPEPPEVKQDEDEDDDGEPHKERPPSPMEIYNESMDSFGTIWTYLFNYKSAPGPNTDINSTVVDPGKKYRLRLFKGLPNAERNALVTQCQHMHMALVEVLKEVRDIQWEEKGNRAGV